MAVHSLKTVQKIPASLERVWEFFSNPSNLGALTPPDMQFQVISRYHGPTIYAGQIIEYKLKPVFGIPAYWMTEITQVKDHEFFIDEQRKGPYNMWHHQHHFREIEGGVEMTDIIHYQNPLGVLGRLANQVLVRKKIRQIFEYRFNKIEEMLGKWKDQEMTILLN